MNKKNLRNKVIDIIAGQVDYLTKLGIFTMCSPIADTDREFKKCLERLKKERICITCSSRSKGYGLLRIEESCERSGHTLVYSESDVEEELKK